MQPDPKSRSVEFEHDGKVYNLKFSILAQQGIETEFDIPFTNAGALTARASHLVALIRYGLIHEKEVTMDTVREMIESSDRCYADWVSLVTRALCLAVWGQEKPPTAGELKKKWPSMVEEETSEAGQATTSLSAGSELGASPSAALGSTTTPSTG